MTNVQFVFSDDITQAVEAGLARYVKSSRARCILLLSKTGHLISQAGFTNNFNVQSISALIGGIFSSTQSLARLVDEDKFSVMFQEGKNWNVYFILIADQFILATIFDKSTVVGMIRHVSGEVQQELEPYLLREVIQEETVERQPAPAFHPPPIPAGHAAPPPQPQQEDEGLPDFNKAVEDALSKLFM